MQIQKVTAAQSVKDKQHTKQIIQTKKPQNGGADFAKILAEQFK